MSLTKVNTLKKEIGDLLMWKSLFILHVRIVRRTLVANLELLVGLTAFTVRMSPSEGISPPYDPESVQRDWGHDLPKVPACGIIFSLCISTHTCVEKGDKEQETLVQRTEWPPLLNDRTVPIHVPLLLHNHAVLSTIPMHV